MSRQKKPYVTVEADCPTCKSKLRISVSRTKTNNPEPTEYDVTTKIEVIEQTKLFMDRQSKPRVKGKRGTAKVESGEK